MAKGPNRAGRSTYFVTGATGFIGSHLVRRLVARGDSVIALTRNASNAIHLPKDATVVEGDIREKESMRDAMKGVDGVFHIAAWYQIGPGPENQEQAHEVNVDGTRNVLELMDELQVPKGVHVSTIGVYGDTRDTTVDESHRPDGNLPTVYQETKWRAHYEVALPMMEAGLPLVVTALGAIYGPGDEDYGGPGHVRAVMLAYLEGEIPMVPKRFVLHWQHIDDTTTSLLSAMDRGEPGQEYIIGGDQRPVTDVFQIGEETTGIPAPRAAPTGVFRTIGAVVGLVEHLITPPQGKRAEEFRFLARTRTLLDNTKAQEDLGLNHRSLEEGLPEYFKWEMEQLQRSTP